MPTDDPHDPDFHLTAPTYVLVTTTASSPLGLFSTLVVFGANLGVLLVEVLRALRGEEQERASDRFFALAVASLLMSGHTCAQLRGRTLHEIVTVPGERTAGGVPVRRFVECDFSLLAPVAALGRALWRWATQR